MGRPIDCINKKVGTLAHPRLGEVPPQQVSVLCPASSE
jgi:hypothetical protein